MNVKIVSTICALGTVACSTTATIRHRNGLEEEAAVVRRTSGSLVVENNGVERTVPIVDVVDVDHPGNVHAIVGSLLLAYGILNIAVGSSQHGAFRALDESEALGA